MITVLQYQTKINHIKQKQPTIIKRNRKLHIFRVVQVQSNIQGNGNICKGGNWQNYFLPLPFFYFKKIRICYQGANFSLADWIHFLMGLCIQDGKHLLKQKVTKCVSLCKTQLSVSILTKPHLFLKRIFDTLSQVPVRQPNEHNFKISFIFIYKKLSCVCFSELPLKDNSYRYPQHL